MRPAPPSPTAPSGRPPRRLGCRLRPALLLCGCACASTQQHLQLPELEMDLAGVLVEYRSYGTAVPLLRRAVQRNPNDARAHRLLGVVLRDKGQYEQAQVELEEAERLAPLDPESQTALGILYDLRGLSVLAEGYHRLAIRLASSNADHHNNLGFCLYLQGRLPEAIAAYKEALRRNPLKHLSYNNLGFAHARRGDMNAALQAFRQGGSEAVAMTNLGLAHELAGNHAEAVRCYERSVKLQPSLAAARDNLHGLLERRDGLHATTTPEPHVHDTPAGVDGGADGGSSGTRKRAQVGGGHALEAPLGDE